MQQCQALVQGFLGRLWVDPTSSWHPSLPCSFQPFCLLWLSGPLLALVGASGSQDVCGREERADCCGEGRGYPQQPRGTTSTEVTAAALPWPSHRCVGTARLAATVAPGQGRDGRGLRQETYIPRRSGPPLGTLPARRAVCGQCHLPWGPGRRCPCLAPLGTAGERRVGGSLQMAPSTASRHSLPPANGCLGGAACGTPRRPQPQPQSHLAVTVVTTQWDGTSVGVAPWLCRPPTHPTHPACWGGSYFEARAV